MDLHMVKTILQAEILNGAELLKKATVIHACGSDLISDALAFPKERTLLLTGLTNDHVVRAAEIIDLVGVVFVNGKRPPENVIQMAQVKHLPLLLTDYPLYEACGLRSESRLKRKSRWDGW
jgi:DRTGG domain.